MKRHGVKLIIPDDIRVLAERQRLEDERSYLTSASNVKYSRKDNTIHLLMRSGVALDIPLRLIDEIAEAPENALQDDLTLAIGGDAISLRSLDVDISIPGLLRDLLGFNIQRLGGRAKTEAKADAARRNGAKGGRPKLQPA